MLIHASPCGLAGLPQADTKTIIDAIQHFFACMLVLMDTSLKSTTFVLMPVPTSHQHSSINGADNRIYTSVLLHHTTKK
jgi:hypothetical protein